MKPLKADETEKEKEIINPLLIMDYLNLTTGLSPAMVRMAIQEKSPQVKAEY